MMIKSMARKTVSFGQLMAYFAAPEETGPAWLHNLPGSELSPAEIRREFQSNAHRLPTRRNGNILYHEILSFSPEDRDEATPAVLEDLTRRYLELRAPRSLAYAQAHFDTDCPHVHILISANEIGSSRRQRLTRQQFGQIKHTMETLQRQLYPELQHSLAVTKQQSRRTRERNTSTLPSPATRRESERDRRLGGREQPHPAPRSRKEEIRATILEALTRCSSGAECYRSLQRQGLQLYRRGKTIGVEEIAAQAGRSTRKSRRYRLRTLGVAETFEQARRQWRELARRLSEIPRSPEPRTPERSLEPRPPPDRDR